MFNLLKIFHTDAPSRGGNPTPPLLGRILYTTNRKPFVLEVVVQARALVVVVQVHVIRAEAIGAIVLLRTPEVRVVATAVEVVTVAPVASRQGGKTEGIRSITIRIPSVCCFEHFSCR